MADVVSRVTRTVTPLIAAATFAIALACRSSEDAGSAATDARARLVSIPLATVGAPPIDVSFAAVPPTSTRHVAVAGSDTSTCGSSTSPCRSIEWAVALGGPGTEVQVHAGTWPIALSVFPGRAGNASAPRALRAAPGERVVLVPKETSPGTWKPPVDLETSYWTVDGFTIDCEDRAGLVGFYAVAADHVALRNSIVTRCPHSAVSIRFNSHHVLVEGNTLRENRSFDANDANGITVAYRSHDIVIRNNRLHQNSSDGFQCQGREQESDPTDLTLDPANILFANNEAHDNMEEAVDIKSCTNVTIAGNRLFGEDATTDAQNNRCGGAAIVGHFGARKLLIDSNRISNSGAGIVLGNVYLLVEDVVVKRNLIYGMNQNEVSTLSGRPQRNCGDGINLQRIRRADVYHNTIDSIPHAGVRIGANAYYRDPFAGGGTCAPFNGKIPCAGQDAGSRTGDRGLRR